MFYSTDILRSTARETSSETALRDGSRDIREEPGSGGVFATITTTNKNKNKQVVGTSKDYC